MAQMESEDTRGFGEMFVYTGGETREAVGQTGRLRINPVEKIEHGANRGMQAVEVQSVEAGFLGTFRQGVVALAQPGDELHDISVAPHPSRKALEGIERFDGIRVAGPPAHIAVNAVGVGPVHFHGNGREPSFLDQAFR